MDVTRALSAVAAALAVLLASPANAAGPARWHFSFGGGTEVSILFERTKAGDATRLLVKSAAGRFIFFSKQDPSDRDSTESIRRLPDGEELSRRLVLYRYGDVPGCETVVPPDACVVFEGKGGTFASSFSAFSGAGAREKAASLVSPAMRDALFGTAPVLPMLAEFGSYTKDFLGLVWPERFAKPQALKRGKRTKGCDFDATFGYPCDADARRREDKLFAMS